MAIYGVEAVIGDIEYFEGLYTRPMFGGTGYFVEDAMFLLVDDGKAFLRGGPTLTEELVNWGCEQYKYKKRIGCAKVQYYNITDMHAQERSRVQLLFFRSIEIAKQDKIKCNCHDRIRDLPNLQLSIERMLARIDIVDIAQLKKAGSSESFARLQQIYGLDLNVNLLWKLEGAIRGIHFSLLEHKIKNSLLSKIASRGHPRA
ncbi:DNA transformation protein [Vibrio inusitatus NBRC 102082]|uniref:DNA transformation protein n=1 Tax=Vibrio inusitatus NBRC 102082 TaxID=1219070 RepID=A0A4Y3HVH5_9VIBR|nr:TfoX/Sxy family DNA transformation protein [Vibrio inusitatus]GEA50995.1 DNA transformation protein [Vibrio inusitatus NBRC 102082]